MLGSITPLGERSRGSRWGATVIMYIAGSLLGGVIVGTAAGLAGAWLAPSHRSALAALGALLAIGALVDTGRSPVTLPTPRRQVNEDWLRRYRSWVYGGGFGLQLGAGVATIVGTAAVYSTFGAAFLSGSPAAGAAIGAAFGLARAVMVLPAGRVRLPAQLGRLDARLRAMDGPSRRVAVSCQVGLAAACLVIALG